MNYEKKYKEALEVAQKLYQDCPNGKNDRLYHTTDLEKMFPELKESEDEDERMKKSIIQTLKKYSKCVEDGNDSPSAKDFLVKDIENQITWLEKQGKTFTKKDVDDAYLKGISNTKNELEKQSKQKPTDKIEHKFKIGDWIVQNNIGIYKIVEVCESWYEVIDNQNNHYSIGFDKEYMCHLWTIKDAKDGDILQSNNKPFIYNEYLEEGKYPFGYGGINLYGRFGVSNGLLPMTHDEVTPATKEQRDNLFKKINEAGYEWDAEKKELKKFEQNPAWSEEDESWFKELELMALSFSNDVSYLKKFFDWLKSLKDKYTWKPSIAQLNALSIVSKGNAPDDIEAIVSLYNDLKKLTE